MAAASKQSPVVSVRVLSLQGNIHKLGSNVDFLLVLSGEIKFQLGEEIIYLNQNDVMMVQAEEHPIYTASGNNLVLEVSIKKEFIQKNATAGSRFICCSAKDSERDYSELRRILSQIALAYFEQGKTSDLRQTELSFSLLYYLSRYHMEEGKPAQVKSDDLQSRQDTIISYLEQHYSEQITLSDLSELTHLNVSYLSRYFRKATGTTLNECLQNIRLDNSIRGLMETDSSITSIAYENGFPSPAAFAKAFYRRFGKTPSDYRKTTEHVRITPPPDIEANQVDYKTIENELKEFAHSKGEESAGAIRYPSMVDYVIEDAKLSSPLKPVWNELINLGYCENLLISNFQMQLKMAKEEIGFRYGRIEGLLNDEITPPLQNGEYNFSEFDKCIDILLNLKIRPFIDTAIRGENMFLVGFTSVVVHRQADIERSKKNIADKLSALVRHAVNNYGIEEVENWIFDIGISDDAYLHITETPLEFAHRFEKMAGIIKSYLPNAKVGAFTYNIGMRKGVLEGVLTELNRLEMVPDFISVCAFPYEAAEIMDKKRRFVTPDPERISKEIRKIKDIMAGLKNLPESLYLVAMGVSMQTEDYINDTCFQSAFLTKNTIDLIGLVDAIGYWKLSDSSDEYTDSSRILFGSAGIISKNGLKKPGFTALKRMSWLDKNLIKKEPGFLATTNGVNSYHMILYNYSHFSDIYCVSGAQGITCESAYSFFAEQETRDVSVEMKGLERGRYKIITTTLNREHGSLLDEWMRFGILDNLQPRDINYLEDIVHPQRLAHFEECEEGVINIHAQLLPHEVKFIEILREL